MSTTNFQTSAIDFAKSELVPAVIQDVNTAKVLMLGYMNKEAVETTLETKKVTFYSRSKQRLWTKGEESGNYLNLKSIELDCDNDTLLIQVTPEGPTCHKGTDTCWGGENKEGTLAYLERTIKDRRNNPDDKSYVSSLFKDGINKIAQKVGEEAVEIVIEAKDDNEELFLNEGADLLFHYLILLEAKGFNLKDILKVLDARVK
jgi:phosphoribosyl-ATP pyrophosphohydrolase/phosphoribosyl-AMP cyclohydrolase